MVSKNLFFFFHSFSRLSLLFFAFWAQVTCVLALTLTHFSVNKKWARLFFLSFFQCEQRRENNWLHTEDMTKYRMYLLQYTFLQKGGIVAYLEMQVYSTAYRCLALEGN